MATIPGVTVNWSLSPRMIRIPAPLTEVSVIDLQDTLVAIEATEVGMNFPTLRDIAGGQALGAGVTVGWTMQLANAQVMFEARTTPLDNGTATSNNSTGTILTDAANGFITDGVFRGCTVFNATSGAMAVVTEVISETQLRSEPLSGGSRSTWLIGDLYLVYPNVQCSITGGNLVAVDAVNAPISAIMPSPNVQIKLESSSSATNENSVAIEYASFNGGVTIDVVNGVAGTEYPKGTALTPVNNLHDAQLIAVARGFDHLHIKGNLTIGATDNVAGYEIHGESTDKTTITLIAGCVTTAASMQDLTLTGHCGGRMEVLRCVMMDIVDFCATGGNSYILDTMLGGTIAMKSVANQAYHFVNCHSMSSDENPVIIDANHNFATILFINYTGPILFKNITNNNECEIYMSAGNVTIDATCTTPHIDVGGTATLVNNSAQTVNFNGLMNTDTIAVAVHTEIGSEIEYAAYGGAVHVDAALGVPGTTYPIGTIQSPVNNLSDALDIAVARGFSTLHVIGDLTIGATDVISNYNIVGEGATFNRARTAITLTSGCLTSNTSFSDCEVSGRQGGEGEFYSCVINGLTNSHCEFRDCLMLGPVQVSNAGFTDNHMTDVVECRSTFDWYVLDYNGSPLNQVYSRWSGRIKITNCTNANAIIVIRMAQGVVWIDSSCTAGTIRVEGIGYIINDSAIAIETLGMINGMDITDLHDNALGEQEFDVTNMQEIKKRLNGSVLQTYDLTSTGQTVPVVIKRTPV